MGLVESGLDVVLVSTLEHEHVRHDVVRAAVRLRAPVLYSGRNLVAGVRLHLELVVDGAIDLLLAIIVIADSVFLLLARVAGPGSRTAGDGRVHELLPSMASDNGLGDSGEEALHLWSTLANIISKLARNGLIIGQGVLQE